VHAEAPVEEYAPGRHPPHDKDIEAPGDEENVPPGQAVHVEDDDEPTLVEYVPAGQLKQPEAPVPTWYMPALQVAHEDDPGESAYVPTEQLEQALVDAAAYVPLPQSAQADDAVAPTALDAVPAAQPTQLKDPATFW